MLNRLNNFLFSSPSSHQASPPEPLENRLLKDGLQVEVNDNLSWLNIRKYFDINDLCNISLLNKDYWKAVEVINWESIAAELGIPNGSFDVIKKHLMEWQAHMLDIPASNFQKILRLFSKKNPNPQYLTCQYYRVIQKAKDTLIAWEKLADISHLMPPNRSHESYASIIAEANKFRDWFDENRARVVTVGFLDLSNTKIRELPEWLEQLKRLRLLGLSNTDIRELPESMEPLRKLTSLELSNTGISKLPESMERLSNLKTLILANTGISELPEWMWRLGNLKTVDLSNTGISELPESMERLSNLQTLVLAKTGISELPEWMGRLGNLQALVLANTGISELPESMRHLSKLETLDISNTGISELPEWMEQLGKLMHLNLSNTEISELPESMGQLRLFSLNISNTRIRELPRGLDEEFKSQLPLRARLAQSPVVQYCLIACVSMLAYAFFSFGKKQN